MATIDANLPVTFDTDLTPIDSKKTILMDDNSHHIEDLADDDKVAGIIVFEPLTEAERDTVMAFYNTNKDLTFDYVNPNDGETYTLEFQDPRPHSKAIPNYSPLSYTVTYTVIGQ